MKQIIHRIAAIVATLCIASFFVSTLVVELSGSPEAIATLKSLIVIPGLFILVPAIAMTGGTGFALSRSRTGKLVETKKRRMPFIAVNGVFVLIPCAIFLERLASAGTFDMTFYVIQAIELIAGAVNIILMGMNIKDGFRMTGRLRRHAMIHH